jgi:hypothetical protein
MNPTRRHQGKYTKTSGVDNKRRRFALLCLIALLLQLTLPVIHAWYAATGGDGAVPQTPPWTLTVRAGSPPALLASVDPAPRHWHHDPALCQVCKTLTQARNYVLTPARTIDIVSNRVPCPLPVAQHHGDPLASATSPRAPPVLS